MWYTPQMAEKMTQIHLRLTPQQKEKLEALAKEQDRSVSSYLRRVIDRLATAK